MLTEGAVVNVYESEPPPDIDVEIVASVTVTGETVLAFATEQSGRLITPITAVNLNSHVFIMRHL